jgi:hypothetical protein
MNSKERDARLVAEYKKLSAQKRATRRAQASAPAQPYGSSGMAVIVRFAPDAKPISELGGPTKAFGPSRISIPEFRHPKRA